ncbi:hypothetical protein ACJX0J_037130 [Zea mays]
MIVNIGIAVKLVYSRNDTRSVSKYSTVQHLAQENYSNRLRGGLDSLYHGEINRIMGGEMTLVNCRSNSIFSHPKSKDRDEPSVVQDWLSVKSSTTLFPLVFGELSVFFILHISMREELPLLRIPGKDRVYQQWKFSKNSNPNVFLSYMYRVIFTGKEDKEEATTYMIEQAVGFHHHLAFPLSQDIWLIRIWIEIDIDIYLTAFCNRPIFSFHFLVEARNAGQGPYGTAIVPANWGWMEIGMSHIIARRLEKQQGP